MRAAVRGLVCFLELDLYTLGSELQLRVFKDQTAEIQWKDTAVTGIVISGKTAEEIKRKRHM
jgi:hypothetical protein